MRLPLSLLLAATLGLPACAQRTATATKPAPPVATTRQAPLTAKQLDALAAAADADTALVFQRTPCYGTCPSYTATVFRSGRVAYFGDRSVPVLGARETRLPRATVTAMLGEAQRIKFGELRPHYLGNVSDLPGTIVAVYQPGQRPHRVEAVYGIPASLQGYITYLRARLDPIAGIGGDK